MVQSIKLASLRRIALSGIVAGALFLGTSAAWADTPTGFGTSWPNAKNVSTAPGWAVYVFAQDGVKYIQINDMTGHVLAAVATANGQALRLPMGSDALYVSTSQRTQAQHPTASTMVVYRDTETTVTATLQADGTTAWIVQPHEGPEMRSRVLSACDGDPGRCSGVLLQQQ